MRSAQEQLSIGADAERLVWAEGSSAFAAYVLQRVMTAATIEKGAYSFLEIASFYRQAPWALGSRRQLPRGWSAYYYRVVLPNARVLCAGWMKGPRPESRVMYNLIAPREMALATVDSQQRTMCSYLRLGRLGVECVGVHGAYLGVWVKALRHVAAMPLRDPYDPDVG